MNKYQYKDVDEALRAAGMLERIRTIVSTAIENGWSVSDVMKTIQREIALITDEFDAKKNKAHDDMVRRELGLDSSAVIHPEDYLRTLFRIVALDGRRKGS